MQGVVTKIIHEADARTAFVGAQELGVLRMVIENGLHRVDVVTLLTHNIPRILSEAMSDLDSDLVNDNLDIEETGSNNSPTNQMAAYSCDSEIILRYLTYILLGADATLLKDQVCNELQKTCQTLDIPVDPVRQIVSRMKKIVITLITNASQSLPLGDNPNSYSNLIVETVDYFDAVNISLGEKSDLAPEPLWQKLVYLGSQVPDQEWEKLPTDLSRNFEHYLYGAPKES